MFVNGNGFVEWLAFKISQAKKKKKKKLQKIENFTREAYKTLKLLYYVHC